MSQGGRSPRARNYALDAIERLTSVTDGLANTLESYTLDEEGNRIVSHDASFHVTDPANRVSEDENWQFEYDVNGNLVRKTFKSSGLTWRYGYSVYDELVSATQHSGPDVSSPVLSRVAYTFDALGRRVAERKFDGAGAATGGTNLSHDGDHLAHEVTLDAAGAAVTSRWYTHTDATDDLVSLTLAAGTGTVSPTATVTGPAAPADGSYYVHTDHQGSVRALTDDLGNVVNHYAYTAYGETEALLQALPQRFRFTAREYDADTGLMHYRARAYDPATGRFLQEDPIWFAAGDLNVYRYVWNNPTNWTDPSGLSASEQIALGGIAIGTAKGLTINGIIRLTVWLRQWNGTRWVLVQTVKQVNLVDKSLGCAIGMKLASIGALIAGASSATADGDNCTVVWNEETPDIETPDPEDLDGLTPEEIDEKLKGMGRTGEPTKNGNGTRYKNPGKPGEQVRIHPDGSPGTSRPDLHDRPYGVVSKGGKTPRFFLGTGSR